MDVLFWSGGKDSYLALEFYRREYPDARLALLTTYNTDSKEVPFQKIPLERIKEQAEHLELDLVAVPLPENCPNDRYLEEVTRALEGLEEEVSSLVFGDWKLEDIRRWREKEFGKRGWTCLFPIWRKSMNELLPVLVLKPVEIKISAVREEYRKYLKAGEAYTPVLIRQLPPDIDPMGENGEFHTEVKFISPDSRIQDDFTQLIF